MGSPTRRLLLRTPVGIRAGPLTARLPRCVPARPPAEAIGPGVPRSRWGTGVRHLMLFVGGERGDTSLGAPIRVFPPYLGWGPPGDRLLGARGDVFRTVRSRRPGDPRDPERDLVPGGGH